MGDNVRIMSRLTSIALLLLVVWNFESALAQQGEHIASSHEEWVQLVRREVDRLHRLPRSVYEEEDEDPALRITDLKAHYREAFDQVKNMASSQDRETTREMFVNGRYIVFMADYTSDRDLSKVMKVLRVYSRKDTSGRFVANHMSPIRHVGKGFTATLSSSVVNVVRIHVHYMYRLTYIVINLDYMYILFLYLHV